MTPNDLRQLLGDLATNLRWSWHHRTAALLRSLPGARADRHPLIAVAALSDADLASLVDDEVLCADTIDLHTDLIDHTTGALQRRPDVVYYSPEFGISELVPQYSGGLGILAGDHLKAASDLGTSLGAVGLLYRQGFFRQELVDGQQSERYEVHDPRDLGAIDTGIVVEVPLADRSVAARVWRFAVGRVTLLALDTDVASNSPEDRAITDRLYSGDRRHRIEQEMILGVGGARAVAAMGWTPGVHHLNEGHAGFLLLELIDRALTGGAGNLDAAIASVRPSVMFTTHTPVPAGIDRFDRDMIAWYLAPWAKRWDIATDSLLELGRDPDAGTDVFNMAVLCLTHADRANGVSRLHGEVSRALFSAVPSGIVIGSVTNGVHARTWVSPQLQDTFDRLLGTRWDDGDPAAWNRIDSLQDSTIADLRTSTRHDLTELIAERTGDTLHPDALVIGFARRFATYKRATLLLRHPETLAALLGNDERPLHIIFAGKAHPADHPGKALLAGVVAHGRTPEANGRFTFIPDYDMGVARAMYHGCDVWLNTPVRPHEASGTSGEKAALNGALNCSIRDGWWAEMSDGRNGWDIPLADPDQGFGDVTDDARDDIESANTLALLAEIAAEFHADGTGHPSAAWTSRMRHAWRTLGPLVTAGRMVAEYDREWYQPMLRTSRSR
ncbi:MAG: alpha-glucan family phosphorylase [Ilumatobacteraceae bacterium]